jgi:hypothetical protein
MKKQKINKIVVKLTILITELSRKLAYYTSIFAIASASTFSVANAVDVANGATHTSATTADYDFGTAAKDLDVNTSASMTLTIGDITDSAVTGDIDIVTAGDGTPTIADATLTINSIVMDAGGTAGVMTITDADDNAGFFKTIITGDLTLDGTLTVTTSEDTDDELLTVDVGGDTTITGAVELNAGGYSVTGDILMTLAGDATFTAGIDLADVSTTGAATLTFDGTTAQSVTGAIDGDAAGEGIVTVTNATGVTFNTALGATTLDVVDISTATAVATFKAAVSVAGDAIVTGTSTFESTLVAPEVFVETTGNAKILGELTASTQLDLAGSGIATIGFGHTTSSSASAVADIDMAAATTMILDDTVTNAMFVFETTNQDAGGIATGAKIHMPINLTSGQTVKLFSDTDNGGDVDTAVNAALQDTALMTYVSAEASQVVTITATATTDAARATSLGITSDQAKAVSQAYLSAINDTNADATAEDAFANAMSGINGMTATTDTSLALQVAPQSDVISGSTSATRAMTGTVQGIVSNRMASLRSGDGYVTGISAGEGMSANSGFIQAFGSNVEQGNVKKNGGTVYGYDSETSGVAMGFDVMTDNGSTLGLSASFSTTDVDGLGTGKAKNSIDSYTVSVYTDRVSDSGYFEGSLTYGINDNTGSRLVNVAGLNRNYTSNYDSSQLSLKLTAGSPNELSDGLFLTPYGSFTSTSVSTDAYTEKSVTASDNLRLKIVQDDVTSMVGSIGLKAHKITENGIPMISFALNNEFGDTKINNTNTYIGGGSAFKTSTDIEELSATLGLSYSIGTDMNSFNIGYETEWNDNEYVSQYGSIKIVSKF